ncbi:MAG: FtsB family cell division protein [Elusimicrobiota bacterium]
MDRSYRKFIYIVVAGVAIVVLFSGSNFKTIFNLNEDINFYEKKLSMLKEENDRLEKELEWVKNEEDYIKYIARKRLGLVEPEEMKFYLVEEKPDS